MSQTLAISENPPVVAGNRAAWALATWTLGIRLFCIAIWPHGIYSVDLRNWQSIAGAMLMGINPYLGDHLLNWPPLWMEVLFAVGRISDRLDWPFMACLRVFLSIWDVALVLSTWRLLGLLKLRQNAYHPVLLGLCLNPFLILLTIQHANFDVIPTTCILWFLQSLIRYRRTQNPVDWLLAAAFLGLGGFAKTFPLVLIPLLIGQSQRLNLKTFALGAALCFAPAALALAPLYALNPSDISAGVLFYRGTPGMACISGILYYTIGRPAIFAYDPIFTAILAVAIVAVAVKLYRRPLPWDVDLIRLAALLLMAVFLFGPGFSVQYLYWVAPLLVICYVRKFPIFSPLILPVAAVAELTLFFVFAYAPVLGYVLLRWVPTMFNLHMFRWFSIERNVFLFCLPMTFAAWLLWFAGVRSIIAPAKNPPSQQ
ncbi:MAG: hypothetical protein ABSF29_13770 [Tepidisphaeraceae bacterium]|jgi:hypothetical protein